MPLFAEVEFARLPGVVKTWLLWQRAHVKMQQRKSMANREYRLHQGQSGDVVFPTRAGMLRYLEQESEIWTPFFEFLRLNFRSEISASNGYLNLTVEQLSTVFSSLLSKLDDQSDFNSATVRYQNGHILPPRSDSLEGMLILGLLECGMPDEALATYIYTVVTRVNANSKQNDEIGRLFDKGKYLFLAAPIVKALPYSRVSTSKMVAEVRKAENHVQSLAREVVIAREANTEHKERIEAHVKEQAAQGKRISNLILRLNRRRDRQHKLWVEAARVLVEKEFQEASKKVRLFEVMGQKAEQDRVAQFERLQAVYRTQLELRAPAEQWGKREENHRKNSKFAMILFLAIGVSAIAFGLAFPFYFGDYIAGSFSQLICVAEATDVAPAQGCERVFSAKGPVTVTGLLLVMSFLMWMARLQYRIHLSERHLALDASEKKAFAETYLAMKETGNVNKDNEAIVLNSLFRPTQDGIIRDDESALDLSAVAMMAKQFSRNS